MKVKHFIVTFLVGLFLIIFCSSWAYLVGRTSSRYCTLGEVAVGKSPLNSPSHVDVELLPIIFNPFRKDIVPGWYIKGFNGYYREQNIDITDLLSKLEEKGI